MINFALGFGGCAILAAVIYVVIVSGLGAFIRGKW